MSKLKIKCIDIEDEDVVLIKILHVDYDLKSRNTKNFVRSFSNIGYNFNISYNGPYCYYLEKKNVYTQDVIDVSICLGGSTDDISSDTMIFDKKGKDIKEVIKNINNIFDEISK